MDHIHFISWKLLSKQSKEMLEDQKNDTHVRFLIASHLNDEFGTCRHPSEATQSIARCQWYFRLTACWEIHSCKAEYDNRDDL